MQDHLSQYPKQLTTVHVETLDGELCLYDWQRKQVHNLNPVVARVWELCNGETTPQEMAAQLPGDLTPAQAEELVWMSLKRLENAHLLENKVVQPTGRKVYSRREMLTKLGVTALMLLVISTIVAPGPVAAQSAAVTQIVLYDAGGDAYDGDLGGRAGADAICAASANRPMGAEYTNFRAFISISDSDEIRDMPTRYGVPIDVPIVGGDGTTQLAPNWAGLLDGNIDTTLELAGSRGGVSEAWWSGSQSNGSLDTDNCSGWTSASAGLPGQIGDDESMDDRWLIGWGTYNCDEVRSIKCLAY